MLISQCFNVVLLLAFDVNSSLSALVAGMLKAFFHSLLATRVMVNRKTIDELLHFSRVFIHPNRDSVCCLLNGKLDVKTLLWNVDLEAMDFNSNGKNVYILSR